MIRSVTYEDIQHLAQTLREEDAEELRAQFGKHLSIEDILLKSCQNSLQCYVNDAEVADVIFGICPWSSDGKLIWCVGTEEIKNNPIKFCKATLFVLRLWDEHYPENRYYCNFTHEANAVHHKWLEWLGATEGFAISYGVERELFKPFIIMRK